jgi:AsmA protein
MRTVRWILGIVAALVLLLVAALLIVTLVINPNRYRGEIDRRVSLATGRSFVIEGNVRLSGFPWLAVRIGRARLGPRPGQPGPDLIDWRSARLSVRLLPLLLHRQLDIGQIRLQGADIHLWRQPDGRGNWQDLLARSHSQAATPALPAFAGLDIEDGTLHYANSPGAPITLTHWQLRVAPGQSGGPLTVSSRFLLHGGPLPRAGVPVRLRLERLRLEAAPFTVSAPAVVLKVAGVTMRGKATLTHGKNGFDANGALTLTVPSVRRLITLLNLKTRLPKDPKALGKLSLRARWRLKNGALALNPLTARLDATTLTGWVDRSGGPRPLWRFALEADRIDFAHYLPPTRKHPKPLVLPIKALRALHARGILTVEQASFNGTTLRDIRLEVQ